MKLTKRNYFSRKANREYMSVSQFKSFCKCPAAALAELKGIYRREQTTAMLIGSYIDSCFEGTLRTFRKRHPEIFKKDGTLKSEYIQANAIIERIKRDNLFMDYISGEKQVIMTGSISSVPVKIKIDSLHPNKIVDLKIMRDFKSVYDPERGRLPWFEAWGYDLQGAVYQEIVRQNTGKQLPFYLAAATKKRITDLDIVHLSQDMLDFALTKFKSDVERYDAMKKGIVEAERCGTCEYCKISKVLEQPTEADDFYW
nr:MAG TPA: Putative exonuclease [Caudoviricetes sp.]